MTNSISQQLAVFQDEYSVFDDNRINRLFETIVQEGELTFQLLSLESADNWIMYIVRHVSQFDCPDVKDKKIEMVQYILLFCEEIQEVYIVKDRKNEGSEFKEWFKELVEVNSLFNINLSHLIVESSEKDCEEIVDTYFDEFWPLIEWSFSFHIKERFQLVWMPPICPYMAFWILLLITFTNSSIKRLTDDSRCSVAQNKSPPRRVE